MAPGLRQGRERFFVRGGAAKESGNRVLLDPLQTGGHPGLAEIFLREHVRRDLAPSGGNLDAVLRENDRSVGIADFAFRRPKRYIRVGGLIRLGVTPLDSHWLCP